MKLKCLSLCPLFHPWMGYVKERRQGVDSLTEKMREIQAIHSSPDGHLDCFQSLAITNKDATDIHVQITI